MTFIEYCINLPLYNVNVNLDTFIMRSVFDIDVFVWRSYFLKVCP